MLDSWGPGEKNLMNRIAAIVATALMLALIIPGLGCGHVMSSKDVMARFMKMVPEYAEDLYFLDVGAMREDESWGEMYAYLRDEYGFGALLDAVEYLGYSDDINMWIFKGEFDGSEPGRPLSQIAGWSNVEYEFHEYKGIVIATEVGISPGDTSGEVILENIRVAYAPVNDCVDVIVGDAPSFYDFEGMARILDRMSAGVAMEIWYPGRRDGFLGTGCTTVAEDGRFTTTSVELWQDGEFEEYTETSDYP